MIVSKNGKSPRELRHSIRMHRWSVVWGVLLCLLWLPRCNCDYLGGPTAEKTEENRRDSSAPQEPTPEPKQEATPPEERPSPKEEAPTREEPDASDEPDEFAEPGESGETGPENTEEKPPETPPEPPPPVKMRSCKTTFRFDARNTSANSVALAGEFNQWSKTSHPLKDDDGDQIWEIAAQIPAGNHGYKLVINGNDWRFDPSNPERKYVGNTENSLIRGGRLQPTSPSDRPGPIPSRPRNHLHRTGIP